MDVALYKAAERGKIKEFHESDIESLRTPNLNTVLHLHLANHVLSDDLFDSKSARSKFVEQILHGCPSLLLQANAKGETPLHIAARYGHSDIVKFLINYYQAKAPHIDGDLEKQEAPRDFLRKTDLESNTALHIAVEYGHRDVVQALIEFEDPDFSYSANKSQETPLYIAARRKDRCLLAKILNKFSSKVAHEGPHGRTVLHATVMAGDAKATKIILEKKGNLTKETDENGQTPLHYAAHLGYHLIVKELLEWDKSVAYIADKKSEMTPLLMAARQAHENIVGEIILHCPPCCEKVDKKGWNLLHFVAVRQSPSKLFDFLKRKNGTVEYASIRNLRDEKDARGITPQQVYDALKFELFPSKNNQKKEKREQIVKLLEDLVNDEVAEIPVRPIEILSYTFAGSDSSDEKARVDAQLLVATLIATVAFAAAIAVPGGYKSENGPDQGTPFLIRNVAFKAFVITNALAFTLSLAAVGLHFQKLFFFSSSKSTMPFQLAGVYISYAIAAVVIAFSTGTYAMLEEPSPGLAIASCCIGLSCFILVLIQGQLFEISRILIASELNYLLEMLLKARSRVMKLLRL
ncbi:hypothetical protein REPUB_Repub15cG0052700 [Reevesia pubescens]